MSLWGNKDLVANTSTIAVNFNTLTVTGAATTFSTAGVAEGDVLVVGAGATFGYAVVKSVTSNTSLTIHSSDYFVSGITTIAAGASYFITQLPIYTLGDVSYDAPNAKSNRTSSVFGVDVTEQGVASAAGSQYTPAHAGWVGITTYVDMHGNLRVKTETLVAGSMIDADADDDAIYPDA
jgi:hypothetical protein